MQVISQRWCGIDVHKKMLVVCLLLCTAPGVPKEIQTLSTMLQELYRLRDWLTAKQCQAVAMESTGVYGKPIWNVLEGEMELLLCHAQQIKAVRGAKNGARGMRNGSPTCSSMGGFGRALCLPVPNGNCGT